MASAREQRLVFGEAAELYEAVRPSYPAALIDDVVGLVGTPARALDVGCGTGKALRLLAGRGLTGVGVEAHPAMAAVARTALDAADPAHRWRIDVSDFETWEPRPGDAPFDLVTCAQAWHWLDPAVRLHKAHALLRPGGWLALWWNTSVAEDTPLQRAIKDVYARLAPEAADGLYGPLTIGLTAALGGPSALPDDLDLGEPVTRRHPWTRDYSPSLLQDLLRTQSHHRLLPPERLEAVLAAVGRAVEAHGGALTHHYVTQLWAVRRPDGPA